jgi:hypothetical protein
MSAMFEMQEVFSRDAARQVDFLSDEARWRGYRELGEFLREEPETFDFLCGQWREDHPLPDAR